MLDMFTSRGRQARAEIDRLEQDARAERLGPLTENQKLALRAMRKARQGNREKIEQRMDAMQRISQNIDAAVAHRPEQNLQRISAGATDRFYAEVYHDPDTNGYLVYTQEGWNKLGGEPQPLYHHEDALASTDKNGVLSVHIRLPDSAGNWHPATLGIVTGAPIATDVLRDAEGEHRFVPAWKIQENFLKRQDDWRTGSSTLSNPHTSPVGPRFTGGGRHGEPQPLPGAISKVEVAAQEVVNRHEALLNMHSAWQQIDQIIERDFGDPRAVERVFSGVVSLGSPLIEVVYDLETGLYDMFTADIRPGQKAEVRAREDVWGYTQNDGSILLGYSDDHGGRPSLHIPPPLPLFSLKEKLGQDQCAITTVTPDGVTKTTTVAQAWAIQRALGDDSPYRFGNHNLLGKTTLAEHQAAVQRQAHAN